MNKDNRDVLGRLIREELEDSGRGPVAVTSGWSESNVRSFYGWKDGVTVPLQRSRAMLEDALGWRSGVVTEILSASITRDFTLSEVRDWSKLPEPGVVKARHLSNLELGTEIIVRLDAADELRDEVLRLRAELAELRGESNVVALREREQHHFDLAASDEHVPGEDDRD